MSADQSIECGHKEIEEIIQQISKILHSKRYSHLCPYPHTNITSPLRYGSTLNDNKLVSIQTNLHPVVKESKEWS